MPSKVETTRFLCASAYLSGASFRDAVIEQSKRDHQALAPEIGVDMNLVTAVCKQAEKREAHFRLGFALLTLLIILLIALLGPESSSALGMVFVLASAVLFTVKFFQERYRLCVPFLKKNFDYAQAVSTFSGKNSDASLGYEANLVVYSGFTPFVGAGIDFGGWSFAVSTIKPSEEARVVSNIENFSLHELYSYVQSGMDSLAVEEMRTKDFFFVRGDEIREDREIMTNEFARPKQVIGSENAAKYINSNDPRVRHYKWLQVEDWGGELIMSMFFRCTVRGSNLFVEMNRFLLTPLKETYHAVDKLSPPTFTNLVGLFLGSLFVAPFYTLWSILSLTFRLFRKLEDLFGGEERKICKEIRENPLHNFGVDRSLRSTFSSSQFQHYFQKLDSDFYSKILERQILDSIVTFLDDHGIDTAEIKERKRTILNSGIIMQGGNINAESLAIGRGAKAVKSGLGAIKKATEKEAA